MTSKIVHILMSKAFERNEFAFASPLRYNREFLAEEGIKVKFFFEYTESIYECDVLIVSSRYARHEKLWEKEQSLFHFLESLRAKVGHLIWADLSDGTGTGQFGVLDYVDRYVKSSLLKDRSQYGRSYYGGRIFADYYHHHFGVEDKRPAEPHLNLAVERQDRLDKLFVGWNQYMLNYSLFGNYEEKLQRKLKRVPGSTKLKFKDTSGARSLLLNSRISSEYSRNTVAYQRQRIRELLAGSTPTDRVSPKAYYAELADSKYVLSPFGWGEVCYRDFEAILSGSVLIKPNCDHLETWPNFYDTGQTYLPFDWGFENFEDLIGNLENDYSQNIRLAENAQALYRKVLYTPEGRQEFARKFEHLVQFGGGIK